MLRYLPPLPTATPPRFLFRQAAACAHCAVAFDRGFGHINPCFPVDQLESTLSFQGITFYFVCATTKNETKIHRNCTAVHNNDKIRIYFSSSFCFFPHLSILWIGVWDSGINSTNLFLQCSPKAKESTNAITYLFYLYILKFCLSNIVLFYTNLHGYRKRGKAGI